MPKGVPLTVRELQARETQKKMKRAVMLFKRHVPQADIAAEIGTERSYVSRLLSRARQEGLLAE